MTERLIKSKERKNQFGEVFTPSHIVKDMVGMVSDEMGDEDYGFKTWFDPAVGTGNFPIEILQRKLNWCDKKGFGPKPKLMALSTIYAVDIQEDNVKETQERLYRCFKNNLGDDLSPAVAAVAKSILEMNIILGDTINEPEKIVFLKYEKEGFPFNVSEHRLSDMLGEEYMKELEKRKKKMAKRAKK